MPDVQEVYEMVTKHKPPEPGALERQQKRQVRAARNKRLGAFAVAAMIAVAAIALIAVLGPGRDTTGPADEPSTVNPADAAAVKVVTDFHEAYWAYDADRALTYLADGAATDFIGAPVEVGSIDGFRLQLAFHEATGGKEMLDSCEANTFGSGTTSVRCTYVWHGLRSDEIGLGPYSGSYSVYSVRDGEIVGAGPGSLNIDEFSPQMWEPFRDWVSATYPKDFAVMYVDSGSNYRLTEESIRLWEQRTKEYVKEVLRGTVGQ